MKFVLPQEALSQHLAIVGRVGSGKTYTAKGLVERLLDDGRRVCILDPTGAWYGLRSSADGKRAGYPVAVFGGVHGDVQIAERSGAALASILAAKNLPAIIDLSEMLIGQRHRFVTDFCETLYRDNRAPLHLVIDEADEFCPQNPMPETKRMLHHVDRIVRRGRIRGFRVMLITQRPAVLHKNVLTQANTLIAMRLTAPQDRKAILAWVEGQADTVKAKAVLDSLARLPRGEGWVWAPEHDILQIVQFPKISTFDSSRAPGDDELVAVPAKLAEVDIAGIKASFAKVEQEARTLEELKVEVTDLRRKLTAAERRAEQAGVPEAEVQKRIARALAEAPKPSAQAVNKSVDIATVECRKALQRIGEIVSQCSWKQTESVAALKSSNGSTPAKVVRQPSVPSEGLTGPEQRILDAIAWMNAIGVEQPEQTAVAFMAGYTIGGGAWNNPRGSLRTKGLIEYQGAQLVLTDAGRALANPPTVAPGVEALHEAIKSRLPGPETKLLTVLLEAYPQPLSNDDLAERAGYAPKGGAYNNPRGRLRSLGLIEYRGGMVSARDILFPRSA